MKIREAGTKVLHEAVTWEGGGMHSALARTRCGKQLYGPLRIAEGVVFDAWGMQWAAAGETECTGCFSAVSDTGRKATS